MPITYWDRGQYIQIAEGDILRDWPLHHNHRPQYRLGRTTGTITYADAILFVRGPEGNTWLLRAVSLAGEEDITSLSPDRAAAWLYMDGHDLPEELLYHRTPSVNQPEAAVGPAAAGTLPRPKPTPPTW